MVETPTCQCRSLLTQEDTRPQFAPMTRIQFHYVPLSRCARGAAATNGENTREHCCWSLEAGCSSRGGASNACAVDCVRGCGDGRGG